MGTVDARAVTNMRDACRTSAVFSTSGPTMMPGVSQSDRIGRSKASQSCMKRAALSAPSLSMAPARCIGLFAMRPIGRPSMRIERRHHARPEVAPQLEHRAGIGHRLDHAAHVVDAAAVLGDDRAQQALVGALASPSSRPGSTRGTASRPRQPPASSSTSTSITPFADCTSDGPISSGRNTPSPPPSIIAGPPMPMFESFVAITTSQQPSSAALPAKHGPETTPTSGHQPAELAEVVERHAVEPGDARAVRVARPPAAALGEEDDRAGATSPPARTCGPSCGGSADPACPRARCSRRTSRSRAPARAELIAVHGADAADEPIRGRARDQVLHRRGAGAARRSPAVRTRRTNLRRTDPSMFSRAVRWPRARIRSTVSGRAASRPTACRSMHLGEIRADGVEIDCPLRLSRTCTVDIHLLDERERVPLEHRVADAHEHAVDAAAGRGGDHVLHLHRLHHEEPLAAAARGRRRPHRRCDDRALHRRADGDEAGRDIHRRRRSARRHLRPVLPCASTASGSRDIDRRACECRGSWPRRRAHPRPAPPASAACSSMKRRVGGTRRRPPAARAGSPASLMFVRTPSISNSRSARRARASGVARSRPGACTMSFASSESNAGFVV